MGNSKGYDKGKVRLYLTSQPLWIILLLIICVAPAGFVYGQDSSSQDSITTPFRKGRWLSGLSGSLSSNTLKLSSNDELFSSNSYGLEIFTGIFFKDRWFSGVNILVLNTSGAGLVERESESLIIGPSVGYYFLKESYGSLYARVLPGYIRIREESFLEVDDQNFRQLAEGPGFVTRIRLGYSYVISRQIVLDVGVGTNFAWLDVSYQSDTLEVERREFVFSNATFFSFGFNVLLDEFFF